VTRALRLARDLAAPWGALAAGALLGAAVAMDGIAGRRWAHAPAWLDALHMPTYGAVLSFLAAGLGLTWAVRHREALWRRRYELGVGILLFSSHLMGIGAGALNPVSFAIALYCAVWLLDRLHDPNVAFRASGFTAFVAFFFVCTLLSMVGRPLLEVIPGLLATTPKLMIAIVLVDTLDSRARVRHATSMMLWAAAVFATIGIVQVALFYFANVQWSLAAINYRFAYTPYGMLLRATGFAHYAHQFAPPLDVAALMGLALAVSPAGHGRRLRLAGLVALTVTAVFASLVRGSWSALAFGALMMPFIVRPERALVWIGLEGGLLVASFASGVLPALLRGVKSLSEVSIVERWSLFRAGVDAMFSHPVNGVGIMNFARYSPTIERLPVHNAVIQVGSELGLIALVLYAALFLRTGARLAQAMRATADRVVRSELAGILAGLVGLGLVIQGEPMAYSQFVWIYLALGEAAARTVLDGPA